MADPRRSWARALLMALPGDSSREGAALALEGAAAAMTGPSGAVVEAFFRDPAVPKAARTEALAALYDSGDPGAAGPKQVFARFASLLVEKGRVSLIPALAQSFRAFLDGERGIVRLEVLSARDLGAESLERIARAWKESSGAKSVVMDASRDPALLGGFVLRTGSVRYDWSTAGRFKRLRRELSRPLTEGGTERGW